MKIDEDEFLFAVRRLDRNAVHEKAPLQVRHPDRPGKGDRQLDPLRLPYGIRGEDRETGIDLADRRDRIRKELH